MIGLGIDPTDPRSAKGVCAWVAIDLRKRQGLALGELARGRECEELLELIERHQIEAVAVEVARTVYLTERQRGPKATAAITGRLLQQNLLAGRLLRTAESHLPGGIEAAAQRARLGQRVGLQVEEIDAPTWHRALSVRLKRDDKGEAVEEYDAAVERTIRFWLRNWPEGTGPHACDAAGVCLGAFGLGRAKPLTLVQPRG